jgi:sterol 3beta-glucosyltransferase
MEALGMPWVSVVLCPGIIPTVHRGPMTLPNLGRPLNRLQWKLFDAFKRRPERAIEDFLLRLHPRRRRISIVGTFSPRLNLVPCSPHLSLIHPDLPANFVVTGAWTEPEEHLPVPPDLERFVAAGKPDVVFTFGSMGGHEGRVTGDLFLEAIRRTGVRAVIQTGWGDIRPDGVPDDVFLAGYTPHDWLFAQTRVVVHHGGAGTTLAACRAAALSVVVSHLADQPYWGWRLHELGVGAASIPRKRLTAGRLARSIAGLLSDTSATDRARVLAERIRQEDGVSTAVRELGRFHRAVTGPGAASAV